MKDLRLYLWKAIYYVEMYGNHSARRSLMGKEKEDWEKEEEEHVM